MRIVVIGGSDLVGTERSPIPHTVLRATQFFELMVRIAHAGAGAGGHAVRLSPACVQPIASDEVSAAVLADLAVSAPRNHMIEMGGPELFRLDEIVRRALAAYPNPHAVVPDPRARYFGAELSNDTLTPDEGAIIGRDPVRRVAEALRRTARERIALNTGLLPAIATEKTGVRSSRDCIGRRIFRPFMRGTTDAGDVAARCRTVTQRRGGRQTGEYA